MVLGSMKVYPENKGIGEKQTNKSEKGKRPLNPPSMGEFI